MCSFSFDCLLALGSELKIITISFAFKLLLFCNNIENLNPLRFIGIHITLCGAFSLWIFVKVENRSVGNANTRMNAPSRR